MPPEIAGACLKRNGRAVTPGPVLGFLAGLECATFRTRHWLRLEINAAAEDRPLGADDAALLAVPEHAIVHSAQHYSEAS